MERILCKKNNQKALHSTFLRLDKTKALLYFRVKFFYQIEIPSIIFDGIFFGWVIIEWFVVIEYLTGSFFRIPLIFYTQAPFSKDVILRLSYVYLNLVNPQFGHS